MRLSTVRSISVGKVVIIESIINQTSLDSADYKKGVGDRLWDSNINIEVLDTMSEYSLPLTTANRPAMDIPGCLFVYNKTRRFQAAGFGLIDARHSITEITKENRSQAEWKQTLRLDTLQTVANNAPDAENGG